MRRRPVVQAFFRITPRNRRSGNQYDRGKSRGFEQNELRDGSRPVEAVIQQMLSLGIEGPRRYGLCRPSFIAHDRAVSGREADRERKGGAKY
jgi:hypothetical protein